MARMGWCRPAVALNGILRRAAAMRKAAIAAAAGMASGIRPPVRIFAKTRASRTAWSAERSSIGISQYVGTWPAKISLVSTDLTRESVHTNVGSARTVRENSFDAGREKRSLALR